MFFFELAATLINYLNLLSCRYYEAEVCVWWCGGDPCVICVVWWWCGGVVAVCVCVWWCVCVVSVVVWWWCVCVVVCVLLQCKDTETQAYCLI